MEFKLLCGDAIEQLKTLPDESVNVCVTSPPYYGLRDYGTGIWRGGSSDCPHYRITKRSDLTATGHKKMVDSGHPVGDAIYKTICPICGAVRIDSQIGLEETAEEYIEKLVVVFREVKRVLRDDGVLFVNIGDSYNGSGGDHKPTHKNNSGFQGKMGEKHGGRGNHLKTCKPKDLIGIPWMLAFALRADGWYLRQDIIWAKTNPMPESVKDRCTKSHEYIFMLTKNKKYYFDNEAIKEDAVSKPKKRDKNAEGYQADYPHGNRFSAGSRVYGADGKRNKRDVWTTSVASLKEAHFAVFPKELVEPCILAGCPEGGWVLDPFNGSGTSGIVANLNNRNYIGIDLNPEYLQITKRRVSKELGKDIA